MQPCDKTIVCSRYTFRRGLAYFLLPRSRVSNVRSILSHYLIFFICHSLSLPCFEFVWAAFAHREPAQSPSSQSFARHFRATNNKGRSPHSAHESPNRKARAGPVLALRPTSKQTLTFTSNTSSHPYDSNHDRQAFLCPVHSPFLIVSALPGALSPIHSLGSSSVSFATALSLIPNPSRHYNGHETFYRIFFPSSRGYQRCAFAPVDDRSVSTFSLAYIDTG
jgi:hypothetical protein